MNIVNCMDKCLLLDGLATLGVHPQQHMKKRVASIVNLLLESIVLGIVGVSSPDLAALLHVMLPNPGREYNAVLDLLWIVYAPLVLVGDQEG